MQHTIRAAVVMIALTGFSGLAQQPPPAGTGAGRGGAEGQGRGAQPPGQQPVASISQRPNGTSLGTIRVGAADNNMWFGWRVAVPSTAIKGLTFSEALVRADGHPIAVTSVEASSAQITSFEVPKPLDHRLQPGERGAVVYRLRELNQQILSYRIDRLGADEAARRQVFELVKSLNVPLIVVGADTANLAEVDKLAEEFGINVAVESRSDPKAVLASLDGRGKRLGIAADLGGWIQDGVKPADALAAVKDRLLLVRASDRSALGAKGRPVPLGEGAGGIADFFLAAYRAGVKPLSIVIESTGASEADLMKNVTAFERVMWPAMAARVRAMLDTPAGKIRGADRLEPEMRQQIEAAAPRQAIAKPAKPRKLLVTDIQMYSGHSTIPHGTYLLELMGKQTGAFEPIFSNDPELLKYPKVKEFDAIYFNNVCGMVHNDPEVREGLLRFVREGGGIGGHHAVTYANNNWPEFADMMGGWAGAHRIEKQVLKVEDANSPLTKSFGGASFEHTDEFYIFPAVLALLTREAAHPPDHRRREIGSRDRESILQPVHQAGSGLRRGVDQDLRQGPDLLHAARSYEHLLHRSAVDPAPAGRNPVHPRRPRRRRDPQRQADAQGKPAMKQAAC